LIFSRKKLQDWKRKVEERRNEAETGGRGHPREKNEKYIAHCVRKVVLSWHDWN